MCLANYRMLKAAIEKICQLNQLLLRSEKAETKTRRPRWLISAVPASALSAWLEDEQLVNTAYEALLKRSPQSRTRGRRGVAAEIVLRMLLLKHYP